MVFSINIPGIITILDKLPQDGQNTWPMKYFFRNLLVNIIAFLEANFVFAARFLKLGKPRGNIESLLPYSTDNSCKVLKYVSGIFVHSYLDRPAVFHHDRDPKVHHHNTQSGQDLPLNPQSSSLNYTSRHF